MSSFLSKIGLIYSFETSLSISKTEFVEKLSKITVAGSPEMFADSFEALRSGNFEYKGIVNSEGFRIKKKKRILRSNLNLAIAEGNYLEGSRQLIVYTEINGFNKFFKVILIFMLLLYIAITAILFKSGDPSSISFLPFIPLHALILFGIFYILLKISVNRLRNSLIESFSEFDK